jgi:hypothetical protein
MAKVQLIEVLWPSRKKRNGRCSSRSIARCGRFAPHIYNDASVNGYSSIRPRRVRRRGVAFLHAGQGDTVASVAVGAVAPVGTTQS